MRGTILAIALGTGVAALAGGPAYALDSADTITGHIPFSFRVGNETLPAGSYVIRVAADAREHDVLVIRSADGHHEALVMGYDTTPSTHARSARLVFDKIGQDHYLRAVWVPGETGEEIPATRAEVREDLASAEHAMSAKRTG
jgi:hypothetical protein